MATAARGQTDRTWAATQTHSRPGLFCSASRCSARPAGHVERGSAPGKETPGRGHAPTQRPAGAALTPLVFRPASLTRRLSARMRPSHQRGDEETEDPCIQGLHLKSVSRKSSPHPLCLLSLGKSSIEISAGISSTKPTVATINSARGSQRLGRRPRCVLKDSVTGSSPLSETPGQSSAGALAHRPSG